MAENVDSRECLGECSCKGMLRSPQEGHPGKRTSFFKYRFSVIIIIIIIIIIK